MDAVDIKDLTSRQTISEKLFTEAGRIVRSVGGWWATILYLILISWYADLDTEQSVVLYAVFTNAIAFSMIFGTMVNALLSQVMSNDIFLSIFKNIPNELAGGLFVGMPGSFLMSFATVISLSDQPFSSCLMFACITSVLTGLWITNNAMSLLQKKSLEFVSLVIGMILGFFFFLVFGKTGSIQSIHIALVMSFSFTVFFQFACIVKEFRRAEVKPTFVFLKEFRSARYLPAFLFFTFGVWIDKFVFWYAPETSHKIDFLFRYSDYDLPFFVTFTIFSISQFLILRNIDNLVERPFKEFSHALTFNAPFSVIHESKIRLISGYQTMVNHVLFGYSPIIMVLLYLSPRIDFPWQNPYIFHNLMLATFFFALFTVNYLILQYLNCHRDLIISAVLMCAVNFSGSLMTIFLQQHEFYGFGFLAGSLVGAVYSGIRIHVTLGTWEFKIFREIANEF